MSGAEAVYERAFAAQWLTDSKGLILERWSFADYLGAEWEQLGLHRHTPVALCWGDFFGGKFAGYALNGRAGSPFVALAAGTQLLNKWRARPPLRSSAVGQERAYSSARTLPAIREAVESWEQSKTRLRIGLRRANAICIQKNWGDGQRRLMITGRPSSTSGTISSVWLQSRPQ